MDRALILVASLCALTSAPRALAAEVFRCNSKSGVSFQDTPCPREQTQSVVHLPADLEPASTPKIGPIDEDAAPKAVPVAPVHAPPHTPLPAFYLCTRQDDSVYLSEDGIGGRSAVPLGMLGVPNRSLADAYSARNGIGVSAPGLRPIPHIPASQAPLAGSYVWIDDVCHFANPREACSYLRSELDTVESKLRRAFSDDEPQLKQDEKSLRERARGC